MKPAYGAIIYSHPYGSQAGGATPPVRSPGTEIYRHSPLRTKRLFADGRTSFVVRAPKSPPLIMVDPSFVGTELELAGFAAASDGTILQRLASGRIRIFRGDVVYSEEGGTWLARRSAAHYRGKFASLGDPRTEETAQAILELCVHNLSPAGRGATLIWFPDRASAPTAFLDRSAALEPPELSASINHQAPSVSHALGQLDRAVILGGDGSLQLMNVTLECRPSESKRVFVGGTRHTSAMRYSRSQPEAVVFVVSADGPVTVLHRGSVIVTPNSSD